MESPFLLSVASRRRTFHEMTKVVIRFKNRDFHSIVDFSHHCDEETVLEHMDTPANPPPSSENASSTGTAPASLCVVKLSVTKNRKYVEDPQLLVRDCVTPRQLKKRRTPGKCCPTCTYTYTLIRTL